MHQRCTILHKCTDPGFMESGGVDRGIDVWTGEFLWARLIFSQHGKYCHPLLQYWESSGVMGTGPSQNFWASVGGRKEEHSC